MRICMVLETDFPPDIRVEKEARALLEAGHEITLICEGRARATRLDAWEGIRIVRVPSAGWADRLSDLSRMVLYRDPRFARVLKREVEHADALHVHDLALAATGLAAAVPSGTPVVLDLHENLPWALQAYRSKAPTYWRLLADALSPLSRLQRYERRAVSWAQRVIVIAEEVEQRLISEGAAPERIVVVENSEDPDRFLGLPRARVPELDGDRRLTLIYVGMLSDPDRGLDTVIDAMPAILEQDRAARFVIVGDGPIRPDLEQQAERLRVEDAVEFLGLQPFERVPSFLAAADICLIPNARTPQREAGLPHKLFQYMLMAKPLVVSDCHSLDRIVSETEAGVIFEAGNPASLADAVLSLRDPERRRVLGAAGRRAASTTHSWKRSAKRLIQLYTDLEAGG